MKSLGESRRRAADLKHAFALAYGVEELRLQFTDLVKLLGQGGGKRLDIDRVLRSYFNRYGPFWDGTGGVLDRAEIWGRGRRPLFLLSQPTCIRLGTDPSITPEAAALLRYFRSLDLTVRVLDGSRSRRGAGSVLVAVYHWPTVRKSCGPSAPFFPPGRTVDLLDHWVKIHIRRRVEDEGERIASV